MLVIWRLEDVTMYYNRRTQLQIIIYTYSTLFPSPFTYMFIVHAQIDSGTQYPNRINIRPN